MLPVLARKPCCRVRGEESPELPSRKVRRGDAAALQGDDLTFPTLWLTTGVL